MAWNWNYFTLENMCKAKCSLCDQYERPTIHIEEFLYNHMRDNSEERHKIAYQIFQILIKNRGSYSGIDWDLYYKTEQPTRNIFNPKVICEYCEHVIPIQDTTIRKEAFIKASPEMISHLKDKHGVDEKNWMPLKSGILKHAGDYCNVPKLGVIYKCKKCGEIQSKNGIMFVKHLLDKHRCDGELDEFPWTIIPKELYLLSIPKSEDIDVNRPDSSRDILKIIQGIQQHFNTIANVFDENLQSVKDIHVPPSIQLPSDPKDISSISSRKRKNDTQIEEPPYKHKKFNVKHKKFNVKLIKNYNDEILNSIYNKNEEFEKLMYANEETIFDLIKKINKILEEISKDDS